ncbi:bifunctional hydroxymethylpyrimidine kinase/phosphomethylpyrimidine kinase [Magnetospira sp. QH-2]|uniref:bifunctional hydroxymethylpyrimidine kinase/phosphomethylpyrimidine kinase n=1 Tax=Magnetospira sp. (strain QH-2) TaxID=1288970 RepID=UPI0003E81BB3|nr:bifunctional hydroxymethylpyrimidine kinase/phosphomethylpyrimidine kinase [Magnetospira sp. QH-2]CCQ73324.1 Phosphomethylpyrimidine kinase [Magnetospira sp. QH-2]
MTGRVLIVAGSDSGGGAGIQADLKTVTCLGGYAATAITALTAQNTLGVTGIFDVPPDFIARQMIAVLDDIGADCIKIGMLHRPEVIETVVSVLDSHAPDAPIVVDPVMIAKGGASLLEDSAVSSLKAMLVSRATVLTPNVPEAEVLTDSSIVDADSAEHAGKLLCAMGAQAVLMKGGHMTGETVVDRLIEQGEMTRTFSGPRVETRHTHGTGCTMASAIATGLAQGLSVEDAVSRARIYVQRAIETAPGLGQGHGPLNHGYTVTPG